MMLLSICVCTITGRNKSLCRLLNELHKQAAGKPVQILWLGDNRTMTLGKKREHLFNVSCGDYVSFVDDDDEVAHNYVEQLLAIIESHGPDCITFDGWHFNNGHLVKRVKYGLQNTNTEDDEHFYRGAIPICCFSRDMLTGAFPDQNFSEDTIFAARMKERCADEFHIDAILYHHLYSPETSVTSEEGFQST